MALAGILGGLVMEGGRIKDITQLTAAMIVLGGTAGADKGKGNAMMRGPGGTQKPVPGRTSWRNWCRH